MRGPERVPDCTERRNMRRYGLGDLFFSYHAKVCARVTASAETASHAEVQVEGSFSGGVGE